jgi:hypothetical protein
MNARRLSRLAALTTVFAGALIGAAQAGSGCLDNGICYSVAANGDGTTISFNGFPRVGDYVTQSYNVRGMEGGPVQVEIHPYESVQAAWGAVISVQACRKRALAHSLCSPWSSFKAF